MSRGGITDDAACKESGNPEKQRAGLGMPATLYLDAFAEIVRDAFGTWPYLVGTALTGKTWRDVDVRVMLPANEYEALNLGNPKSPHENPAWRAFAIAFSALGRQMTGLPIDFQIQEVDTANAEHEGNRSALILGTIARQNRGPGKGLTVVD